MKLRLAQIAHARSGDKADVADIGLFAWEPLGYAVLTNYVTIKVIQQHFAHLWPEAPLEADSFSRTHRVERYDLPRLLALKFVMHGVLNGGAASSLRSDNLGKTLGAQLLRMEIDVPEKEALGVLRATEKILLEF